MAEAAEIPKTCKLRCGLTCWFGYIITARARVCLLFVPVASCPVPLAGCAVPFAGKWYCQEPRAPQFASLSHWSRARNTSRRVARRGGPTCRRKLTLPRMPGRAAWTRLRMFISGIRFVTGRRLPASLPLAGVP